MKQERRREFPYWAFGQEKPVVVKPICPERVSTREFPGMSPSQTVGNALMDLMGGDRGDEIKTKLGRWVKSNGRLGFGSYREEKKGWWSGLTQWQERHWLMSIDWRYKDLKEG